MKNNQTAISSDFFFIDRNSSLSLQVQLISLTVSIILEKNLKYGTRFPSTRVLAKYLNISRLTVSLAYQELVSQGYLVAIPKSGYAVAEDAPKKPLKSNLETANKVQVNWSDKLKPKLKNRRQIIKPNDWDQYPYPFIYGQMDKKLFNHTAWRECARQAFGAKDFSKVAGDWAAEDDAMLIDYICARTLPRRGIDAKPEEVLITMGAQNALWLAVNLLSCNCKQKALFEDPGYPDIVEMLRRSGMEAVATKVDEQGFNPDLIPLNTGLVSVTPSHHVPTGVTMPMARRKALIKKSEEDDFIIIEDDYEFERSFLAPASPSLKSMDNSGRIIYISSFSKSIFPGLRLGYMVAPEPFIKEARALRALILRHPPGHLQRITAYFLAQGYYDALIVKTRQRFKQRHEILVQSLDLHGIKIASGARHGGSSLWIEGPKNLDSSQLSKALRDDGVLIEAGKAFFENPQLPCSFFRLAYSSISTDKIPKGVSIIANHLGI